MDYPTITQISDATTIVDTNGERVPGAFVGGHTHPITATVQAELVAAGYSDYIT